MPKAATYGPSGKFVGEVDLPDAIFGLKPHKAVVHQAVVAQLAGARAGTHSTLTRGEVSGSTRKLWRQKGTGRARHGSRKAPIFMGGGITFGPKPRDYTQRLPKKMRALALRSVFSDAVAGNRLTIVSDFGVAEGRTREVANTLGALSIDGRACLVVNDADALVRRAARNLADVVVLTPGSLNVADLLAADRIIVTQSTLGALQEVLS
ncbi:MAG: 50S ribosomal protein L4 [Armatimonadetes bacterium]|nr:50S ribosomal protein L4 [Armatimonadota bacterium]